MGSFGTNPVLLSETFRNLTLSPLPKLRLSNNDGEIRGGLRRVILFMKETWIEDLVSIVRNFYYPTVHIPCSRDCEESKSHF